MLLLEQPNCPPPSPRREDSHLGRANMGIDTSASTSPPANPQAPQPQFSHLDKYKALFDASNPNPVPSIDTRRGLAASADGVRTSMLSAIPQEQGSQTQSASLRDEAQQ
ncbi:hypothetical protein BC826DRAFT_1190012 [Russula brevipes]|nr:hypothetical protein BC826DRAFT_1190012 [Russula brevipes]